MDGWSDVEVIEEVPFNCKNSFCFCDRNSGKLIDGKMLGRTKKAIKPRVYTVEKITALLEGLFSLNHQHNKAGNSASAT